MKNFCCICGRKFKGYGNNPVPLKTYGRCCDECNALAIKARLEKFVDELAVEENQNCSKQED